MKKLLLIPLLLLSLTTMADGVLEEEKDIIN